MEMPPRNEREPLRVLTLARLHPRKGHLDTVRALSELPPVHRGRVIYEVGGGGDGDYLLEIERQCAKGGIVFRYLGPIDDADLAAAYAACDVYVMSSRTLSRSVEGFGMTYLEAGAFGKPVVGYRTGGVAEAVLDGITGILVEEGDVAALSGAINRLILEPELRRRLGEAGRAHAARQTWDEAARVLLGD
jgi:glycosyltransferase involved in cell wall biosynthesis